MQNLDKIQIPAFDISATRPKSFGDAKKMFWRFLPFAVGTGLAGLVLLIFQAVFVGTADRFGISPKWSVIFSSISFAAVFGGLAILGGLKQKAAVVKFPEEKQITESICKILMIRRKEVEEKL